jgi:hypothetical protein
MDSFSAWREEPPHDLFEVEMLKELEEIAQRQKITKPKTKSKETSASAATTPTTVILPKTTPTTTVLKSDGEKLLTLAQATENTVKRA